LVVDVRPPTERSGWRSGDSFSCPSGYRMLKYFTNHFSNDLWHYEPWLCVKYQSVRGCYFE